MLFGIAGPTASGKTTVTNALAKKYGAVTMRYSEVLAEIARERGLDATDKATLQNLYVTLRTERGEGWLAEEIAARAKARAAENLIIEGNRRKVDIDTLKAIADERGEPLHFIFIDASPDTRFARYNQRLAKQQKPPITREAFDILEQNPAEDEVNDLREYAKAHGVYIDSNLYPLADMEALIQNHAW